MIYCFDIDGTICSNTDGAYQNAVPDHQVIRRVNRLSAEGHTVILYTARGATTGIDWTEFTRRQLKEWAVNYERLFMGKPMADQSE